MPLVGYYQDGIESWAEDRVKKWQKEALRIQRMYYLNFGEHGTFDEFKNNADHLELLQAKICFALYGAPKNGDEKLLKSYDPDQQKGAKVLLDKVKVVHKEHSNKHDSIRVYFLFVFCLQDGYKKFTVPIIAVSTGGVEVTTDKMFVDWQGRIYRHWTDWEKENNLPQLKYAYPCDGYYTCSNEKFAYKDKYYYKYEFNPLKLPKIEFANSPGCKIRRRAIADLDIISGIASFGLSTVGIASMFTPLAPAGALMATIGTSLGSYSVLRGINRLVDKAQHGESMTDLESIILYASIATFPLNMASQRLTSGLVRGAAIDGRIFSTQWRNMVTVVNCTAFAGNSAVFGLGLVGLVKKFASVTKAEDIPLLDLVQFSMSAFFYTHSLIQPKIAGQIIMKAQKQRLNWVGNSMKDENARQVYEKLVRESHTSIKQGTKLIRMLNRITNADVVFGKFDLTDTLRTGGVNISRESADGAKTTFNPARMPLYTLEPTTNQPKIINKNEFEQLFKEKVNQNNPEDIKIGGKALFADMPDWLRNKVARVLNSVGRKNSAVFEAAFKLAENFPDATLNDVLSLIEIVHHDSLNRDKNIYPTTKEYIDKMVETELYCNGLKKDLEFAASNTGFADSFRAVYHHRKHGKEFTNGVDIEVYLGKVPEELIQDAKLSEVQELRDGAIRRTYVTRDNKVAVVFVRDNAETIASMYTKHGSFVEYMKMYLKENNVASMSHPPMEIFTFLEQLPNVINDLTTLLPGIIFVTLEDKQRVSLEELYGKFQKDFHDICEMITEPIVIPKQDEYKNCPISLSTGFFTTNDEMAAKASVNDKNGLNLKLNACASRQIAIDNTGYSELVYNQGGIQFGIGDPDDETEVKLKANVDIVPLKVERAIKFEYGPGIYGSFGFDLSCGGSVGTDGVEAKVFGLGFSFGPRGKFGISTPFLSVGACTTKSSPKLPQTSIRDSRYDGDAVEHLFDSANDLFP